MNYWEAFGALKSIQDELEAVRFSIGRAMRAVQTDVTLLSGLDYSLKPSQIRDAADNLEFTYVLRLFAEFEAILRDYWASVRPRRRPRRTAMEILMNRIAIECQIPNDILRDAHDVRDYRNAIVHDRQRTEESSLYDCKSRLGFFLSYLPRRW